MKIITDIESSNIKLEQFVGAKMQIAFYSESLKRIAIRLNFDENDEIIYIVGIGCEYMRGKFTSEKIALFISKLDDKVNNKVTFELKDENNDFLLVFNGGISIATGKEDDFGTNFENFIANGEQCK